MHHDRVVDDDATAMMSPSIVKLLIVKPMTSMNANVPTSDVGIDSVAITVVPPVAEEEQDRRADENRREQEVRLHLLHRVYDEPRLVAITSVRTSGGSPAEISASRALTPRTTATVLLPDCFWTIRLTAF